MLLKTTWKCCKPFLFGSIGAAVDLSLIKLSYIGMSFVVIMMGEVARFFAVILVTCKRGFTFKE